MTKAGVSKFFAWLGFAIIVVACFVTGIPHPIFHEGGLFYGLVGLASWSLSYAIDHTVNFFGLK